MNSLLQSMGCDQFSSLRPPWLVAGGFAGFALCSPICPPFFGFVRLFSWVVIQSCAELCRDLGRWRLRGIGGIWTSKEISMRFFGADFRIGSMEIRPLFSIHRRAWGEPGTGIQIAQAVQEMGNFRRCTFVTAP